MPSSYQSRTSETKGQKVQVWKQAKRKKSRQTKTHASCPNIRRNQSRVAVRKKRLKRHGKTCSREPLTPFDSCGVGMGHHQVPSTRLRSLVDALGGMHCCTYSARDALHSNCSCTTSHDQSKGSERTVDRTLECDGRMGGGNGVLREAGTVGVRSSPASIAGVEAGLHSPKDRPSSGRGLWGHWKGQRGASIRTRLG